MDDRQAGIMVTDEYRAYLLRLWRVEDDGSRWRALLENVETGERLGFADLDKLIDFLRQLTGPVEKVDGSKSPDQPPGFNQA